MATATWTAFNDAGTSTALRAWGAAWHSGLTGLGTIVQTADTGQVDWTTTTTGGYEIWRFNDALQSTSPIYIRFGFDIFSSAPRVAVSFGTGTDGAGTLTGNVSTAVIFNTTRNTTTQGTYYASSATSRLTMWLFVGDNSSALFTLERPQSNVGADIDIGAFLIDGISTSSAYNWVAKSGGLPATYSQTNAKNYIICASGGTLIGTQMTAFSINGIGPNYQVLNAARGILLYNSGDLGLNGTLPLITMYGATHQFINPAGSPANFGKDQISNSLFCMMLYE